MIIAPSVVTSSLFVKFWYKLWYFAKFLFLTTYFVFLWISWALLYDIFSTVFLYISFYIVYSILDCTFCNFLLFFLGLTRVLSTSQLLCSLFSKMSPYSSGRFEPRFEATACIFEFNVFLRSNIWLLANSISGPADSMLILVSLLCGVITVYCSFFT